MISDSAYPKFNLQYEDGAADTVFWAVMNAATRLFGFPFRTRDTKDLITSTEVIHTVGVLPRCGVGTVGME
jgi:hypothetical protein